jgi:glycosyltransferase involved in cell wall biosynthesis
VLPSRSEGFSISTLEAAAAARAMVISDTGGARELMGGIAPDLLCVPGDPGDLTRALRILLGMSADARSDLGLALKKHVRERFTFDVAIEQIMSIYDDCLAEANS